MSFLTKRRISTLPADNNAFPAAQLFLLGRLTCIPRSIFANTHKTYSTRTSRGANCADKHITICMEVGSELRRLFGVQRSVLCWPAYLCLLTGKASSFCRFIRARLLRMIQAEACSGMFWGALSDRIGRKPVVFIGCAGTITSLLLVGFAPNFWIALTGRIVGGALNGNIGAISSMVICTKYTSLTMLRRYTNDGR